MRAGIFFLLRSIAWPCCFVSGVYFRWEGSPVFFAAGVAVLLPPAPMACAEPWHVLYRASSSGPRDRASSPSARTLPHQSHHRFPSIAQHRAPAPAQTFYPESYLDNKLDCCLDSHRDSYLDSHLDSFLDSNQDSYLDRYPERLQESHQGSHPDSELDSYLDSYLDSCLARRPNCYLNSEYISRQLPRYMLWLLSRQLSG